MATTDDKLAALRTRQNQLTARIAELEAAAGKQARKEETRLKILIGAIVLADTKTSPRTSECIREALARHEIRPHDRAFLKAKKWL